MANKKQKIMIIFMLFIFLSSMITFAYYTNTKKFYDISRTNDGNSGQALIRSANEFIIDGCGTGTMIDTLTGLCWDRNMDHSGTTLAWALNSAYLEPTWDNTNKVYTYPSGKANYPAFAYCEDLVIGTKTDWRLPSAFELNTLSNEITYGGTCVSMVGAGFTNCINNAYWTQDDSKYNSALSILSYMDSGTFASGGKTMPAKVLCVRRDNT